MEEVEKKEEDLNTSVDPDEANEAETNISDSESTANKLWGNAKRYRGVNFSLLTTRKWYVDLWLIILFRFRVKTSSWIINQRWGRKYYRDWRWKCISESELAAIFLIYQESDAGLCWPVGQLRHGELALLRKLCLNLQQPASSFRGCIKVNVFNWSSYKVWRKLM